MRPANKLVITLSLLLAACAPKSGLSEAVLELEQEVNNMRRESTELRERIYQLENRLGEMYKETENQSKQINETTEERY